METGVILVDSWGRIAFCRSATTVSAEPPKLRFFGPLVPVGPSKHGPVESVRIRLRAHKVNWGRDAVMVWRLGDRFEEVVAAMREEGPNRK
jgi:hypothetical protein